MVQAGKCGIGRAGAWNVGPWAKSAMGEDFVVFPYPPMKKGQRAYQVSWSNAIAMNGASKAEDATYAVFKALLSKSGQTLFYEKLTSAARTDLDWGKLARVRSSPTSPSPRATPSSSRTSTPGGPCSTSCRSI